jgi:hypothetical protein
MQISDITVGIKERNLFTGAVRKAELGEIRCTKLPRALLSIHWHENSHVRSNEKYRSGGRGAEKHECCLYIRLYKEREALNT